MILQVHDELVFEVEEKSLKKFETLVKKEMAEALPLSVPIGVEVGSGRNWLEAH
jgi:DNA polymerase-1